MNFLKNKIAIRYKKNLENIQINFSLRYFDFFHFQFQDKFLIMPKNRTF